MNAQVWIAQRVTELLGVEDDVLIGYVYEQLENQKVFSNPDLVCCLLQLAKLDHQPSAYPTAVRQLANTISDGFGYAWHRLWTRGSCRSH